MRGDHDQEISLAAFVQIVEGIGEEVQAVIFHAVVELPLHNRQGFVLVGAKVPGECLYGF
jgi:hypothetical protein